MRTEQIGDCKLILGDCLDVLPTLGRLDSIVTDPPYGINISANPVRQKHDKTDWDAAPPTSVLFGLILGMSRYQIIWGGNYFPLPPAQCFLVWDKLQPENFSLAMCEQAWTNISKPAKAYKQSVTSYAKEHPTQKPVELMQWCLTHLPAEVQLVCDPFMGSGTTGVACAKRGLKFIGIEKHEPYFDIACRRIEAAYKQPDMFVERPPPPKQEAMF